MAKEVSQKKLDKISARAGKRSQRKSTREANKNKKFAARKGISVEAAAEVRADKKQKRKDAWSIRGAAAARAASKSPSEKFKDTAKQMVQVEQFKNQLYSDNVSKIRATPFTKKSSCKY